MKLLRLILSISGNVSKKQIIENEILRETDDNYILRYDVSGQQTRRIAKDSLMKVGVYLDQPDDMSAYSWCQEGFEDEAFEKMKDTLMERLHAKIDSMESMAKRYRAYTESIPKNTETIKRKTFEEWH
jgi:hypothetical protein